MTLTAKLSASSMQEITQPIDFPKPHYTWPYVDKELENNIIHQLHTSLSIRDNSGIIGEFENKFANFIGAKHAVTFSSGTSAIHAMCIAAGLQPGDEILCPVYTFFATITPFVYEGITPIFCDSDPYTGNISIKDMESKISHKTKAVIVAHMWGIPCDISSIKKLCEKHSLYLFEDCAHAHFAKWEGKSVGTFGDMGAFSLNQKAITSGEGGILITDNDAMKEKALLFGHYNFRCQREIDPQKPYYKYALTGMGLKHRAHPLAMALGVNQLNAVKDIESRRRRNLITLTKGIKKDSALQPILIDPIKGEHGLYVLGLRFDSDKSAYSREEVLSLFHQAGAYEIDVPGSTSVLHKEPLFNHEGFLKFDSEYKDVPIWKDTTFPGAEIFDKSIIKCPLWGYPGDEDIVDAYAHCIAEVSSNV